MTMFRALGSVVILAGRIPEISPSGETHILVDEVDVT